MTEGGYQRKIIQFLVDELCKRHPVVKSEGQTIANAPGSGGVFSGCAIILAAFLGGLACVVVAAVTILT